MTLQLAPIPADGLIELDVREVAARLGVSRRSVRRYLENDELHGTRTLEGWTVMSDEVARFALVNPHSTARSVRPAARPRQPGGRPAPTTEHSGLAMATRSLEALRDDVRRLEAKIDRLLERKTPELPAPRSGWWARLRGM